MRPALARCIPTPHRLEADGLLSSRQEAVEGRVRRIHRATEAGVAALVEDRKALLELAHEVLPEAEPERPPGLFEP
ncbi:hypothetical protein [Nonomuraea sp. NPDC050786]|uniref:PadR family transcriptional regulator n=1 Tax=Nonomuraea sp. NPDC050786 TaxID=3154840 RepID=UPI0033FC8DAF